MNEIALPVEQAAELRAQLTQHDSALVAKLSGTADLRVTESVEAILTRVHQKALELAIPEVQMDLRDLEFMNSSCFKSFVSWISDVSDLTVGQYRIRFPVEPEHSVAAAQPACVVLLCRRARHDRSRELALSRADMRPGRCRLKPRAGPGYMRPMILRPGTSFAVGCVLLSLGCQTRNADKCNQGFDVTRQAIKTNDFASAKTWREYAYKMCDPAGQDKDGLATLDKELATAEATVKANADAAAQSKAKNDALLKLFVGWVGDNRAAPDKASASPVCDSASDPAEAARLTATKEQLCTANRTAGDSTLTVRFWQADTKLSRFSTKFASPVSCQDFGATVSKTFDVPASNGSSVKRSVCDISSGALSGMTVVVSAAANADAYIFTPGYLDKDKQMKAIAGG